MNTKPKLIKAEIVKQLADKEIYLNQSYLVTLMLEKEILDYEDIVNLYPTEPTEENEDEDMECQEIFEWWAISVWLAEKLKETGAPVLDTVYGIWWGRTETGQSLSLDSHLNSIAEKMITK